LVRTGSAITGDNWLSGIDARLAQRQTAGLPPLFVLSRPIINHAF
jgi:hypothetical protein